MQNMEKSHSTPTLRDVNQTQPVETESEGVTATPTKQLPNLATIALYKVNYRVIEVCIRYLLD